MIELKNVNFRYNMAESSGGLHEINLVIPNGEVVLLCGRSGCGKTTLTRLINGLIPNYYSGHLSGDVVIDSHNLRELSLYEISKYVGSVFQNPKTQFFNVDSTSELAFASENQGLPENKIVSSIFETAAQFNINHILGKNIFNLSGGEKQKIACASVSVSAPSIIVLDEPSSNLDAHSTNELRKMISIWKSQGKTIVIAEHRLYYLRALFDRAIYMERGRIKKEYTNTDIEKLAVSEQTEMGLRPFELHSFPLPVKNIKQGNKIFFSNFFFSYTNKSRVLQISHLTLPASNVIAIIGSNGAGKSTFARCVCGLEKGCQGIITANNKVLYKKQRLSRCYMVMQDVNHQLFAESVYEELILGMKKTNEAELDLILKKLELFQYKERHPASLSGGQKQRVAIASALASRRELMVFDEPTSGLDLLHMREVAKELVDLSQTGRTVLVVTHDYELIASCCTYILHLENGMVKEQYPLDLSGIERLKKFFLQRGDGSVRY